MAPGKLREADGSRRRASPAGYGFFSGESNFYLVKQCIHAYPFEEQQKSPVNRDKDIIFFTIKR